MATTGIKNISQVPQVLPFPYLGVVPPNAVAYVADTNANVASILGGSSYFARVFQVFTPSPTPAVTAHGSRNVDETLNANGALSVITATSRCDPSGGNLAMTLANGLFIGQRKDVILHTAPGGHTVVVTPATMAESHTSFTLNNRYDTVELEWQSTGWKVVVVTGGATVT